MLKKKYAKMVNWCYVYEELKSSGIIEVLRLFHAKNCLIELFCVKTDSYFFKNLQNSKIKYVSYPRLSSKTYAYTSIIISECLGEDLASLLDEIIENTPKAFSLYLTELSLEQFLYCNSKFSIPRIVQRRIADCIITIQFDKNHFCIDFNAELFCQSDLMPKLNRLFIQ